MSKLRIIPLGGLDQIGMNITAYEYEEDIIIVDCGLAFPSDDMLGIDLVIPDVRYLEDKIDKIRGFSLPTGMKTISALCLMCCGKSMCPFTAPS